jgi:ketosteroid isomerase-like protein
MSAQTDDDAEVLRLDDAWNDAYRRHDRSPLADVLADDFSAATPSGEPVSKASLMVNPPGVATSVTFSEQAVQVFGDAAVTCGRLQLVLADRWLDQRFLRVFARRRGRWQAVSVAVSPLVP